jgi:hypothetical protein
MPKKTKGGQMKLLKKIAPLAVTGIMLGATFGFAAAAADLSSWKSSFPGASTAIVIGSGAMASEDLMAALNIASTLSGTSGDDDDGTTITGEGVSLDTSSDRIHLNDTVSHVRSTLTKTELPVLLASGTFSGNVEATYTHQIELGNNRVIYAKQPTSSDDPNIGVDLSTSRTDYLYNSTVVFNKAINFTDSDSEGESISLFGKSFVVSTATTTSKLVLFGSAQELSLTAGGASPVTSATVTVAGTEYTVTLSSGSDTSVTIDVNGEQKEISEGSSKKISGLEVAVKSCDESEALGTVTASLLVGAERLTFQDADSVLEGTDETAVDGTYVKFGSGEDPSNLTTIRVSVYAADSSNDHIKDGESLTDPVWGSFKLENAGMSIGLESDSRETIEVGSSGNDDMTLTFTDNDGNTLSNFEWAHNASSDFLLADDSGYTINVVELAEVNLSEYVVVGNEDYGHLLEVTSIHNSSATSQTNDYVNLYDKLSGETHKVSTWTGEGLGSVNIDGRTYSVTVNATGSDNDAYIRINYPDSAAGKLVLWPTIQTSKGAKLAFVDNTTINLTAIDGVSTDLTDLMIPDGDDYATDVDVAYHGEGDVWNFTSGSDVAQVNTTASELDYLNVSNLIVWFECTAVANRTFVGINTSTTNRLKSPAIVLWEEQDDASEYHITIIGAETKPAGTSTDGVGVSTDNIGFSKSTNWGPLSMESVDDVDKYLDYYGTVVTVDKGDSDQYKATVSYPDSHVYAQLYLTEIAAAITGGGGSTGGGSGWVPIYDTDVDSTTKTTKNLIVVGGSAINSIAADLLGLTFPTYGTDDAWVNATGVTANKAIIKLFEDHYAAGKVAMLVAGYEGVDTARAATVLKEGTPAISGTSVLLETATDTVTVAT